MLGAVLVTALLGVALFGPQLVPHSPFTTLGIEFVDGKLIVPPFEPGADYPWGTDVMGRDIMSLVLAGAQLTLQLGLMVMAARMLIGTLLGALAGWFSGRWPDRAILATAETLAAFPMLILAMLLILSLGIRTGLRPFLIALSVVGWTEVMQYVRGEVMATRPKPFIESAVAIGARTRRIVWHHVLPNLLPALVSLAALEMGAVLMLMGELGYIGIFIGGGAFAELNVGGANYQYSDVPEWGALLSNVRLYARVYPWTAIYPAAAFFVAILAFNLFGEGLRRLVETVGAQFTQIWNRYTFAVILLLFVVAAWVNHNTGPMAFFRQQAIAFSAVEAENHVQRLTDPILTGRSLGSPGLDAAAAIVEENYAALGLQHGGSGSGYRQVQAREFQQLDAVPELVFDDGGAPLEYRRDFAEYAGTFRVLGDVTGPVDALVMGELSGGGSGFSWRLPRALNGVEMSEKILLLLSPEDANLVARMPYRGILIVTDDPTQLARRYTLPALDPTIVNFGGRATGQDAPIMWIGEEAANRLLAASGWTVAELRRAPASLGPDEIIQVETGITAHMQIAGTVHEGVESAHIIGHLPAVQGQGLGDQVILVTAQYDAPPLVPDGVAYPGAGDNAGGVAVMLEAIRVLQETGYRPYKTFLFVAYSGEGSELGVPAYPPDVREFLQGRPGFAKHFDIEAVVDLRGLGGADGDRLVIEAGSSLRLANLFDDAATQLGVDAVRVGAPTEIIVSGSGGASSGQIAPQVGLRWQGWEERSRTAADTPTTIEGANLEQAGRTLALGLMVLGRETQY
jgi:peptide/nickel transport system permease protein